MLLKNTNTNTRDDIFIESLIIFFYSEWSKGLRVGLTDFKRWVNLIISLFWCILSIDSKSLIGAEQPQHKSAFRHQLGNSSAQGCSLACLHVRYFTFLCNILNKFLSDPSPIIVYPGQSRCLESLCGDFPYIAVLVIGAVRRSRD